MRWGLNRADHEGEANWLMTCRLPIGQTEIDSPVAKVFVYLEPKNIYATNDLLIRIVWCVWTNHVGGVWIWWRGQTKRKASDNGLIIDL